MDKESVHSSVVHEDFSGPVHKTEEDRKEYRRKWMARKREEDRLRKEQVEDREGGMDASEAPVGPVLEKLAMSPAMELTKTDRKFEEQRPNYWIYGKEVIERECWKCGTRFKTRLEMNKFCGPKCKEGWLSDAFGKLRKEQ